MNGEESGNEGRMFAHIATGPNAGTSYELPALGKFSSENNVASPATGDKTVVAGMDDSTPGQVYLYIGTKTNSGTEVDKAGLTNGKLYGVAVAGMLTETSAGVPAAGTAFSLVDLGDVKNTTGTTLNTNSNNLGVTTFLRPEDGAWDPSNPKDFYFVTTNAFSSPSRLWRLRFTDINNPQLGGTITAVLEGNEGQIMLDNIGIDNSGHIMMVEDVGSNAHLGKVWQYTIASDVLTKVGEHDPSRFIIGGANYLTQDEEASGIIDAQSILGPGMFLLVDQAHYPVAGEQVEGGQILSFFNPDTYHANPEINIAGNHVNIINGDASPSLTDHTDFGTVAAGDSAIGIFAIQNSGTGSLTVTSIDFSGVNASEFTLVGSPALPITIPAGGSQNIHVQFTPTFSGMHATSISVQNSDVDESSYTFALSGASCSQPDSNVIYANGSLSGCAGDSVVLTASSASGLSYQWFRNGNLVPGATLQKYAAKISGSYTVKLSTSMGCSSVSENAVDVVINSIPAITSQPLGLKICVGGTAQFSMTASGAELVYQWQENLGSGVFYNLPENDTYQNVNTPVLTISNVPLMLNGRRYRCVVDGACLSKKIHTSPKMLIVKSIVIVQQPVDVSACVNSRVYVSTQVSGPAVKFQWQKKNATGVWENLENGTSFVNVTTHKLALIKVKLALNNAEFRCALTSDCDSLPQYTAVAKVSVQSCGAREGDEETENMPSISVSVVPNPVADEARLVFNITEPGLYIWEVFNASGVKVTGGKVEAGKTQLSLPTEKLSNGTYFVSLSKNGVRKDYVKVLIAH